MARNTMAAAMAIAPTALRIMVIGMVVGITEDIILVGASLAEIMVAVASTEGKLCVWRRAYCTWAHN